jgi:hypothetical protein
LEQNKNYRLVSSSNHSGTILELATTITHFDILSQAIGILSHAIHNLSDISATIA